MAFGKGSSHFPYLLIFSLVLPCRLLLTVHRPDTVKCFHATPGLKRTSLNENCMRRKKSISKQHQVSNFVSVISYIFYSSLVAENVWSVCIWTSDVRGSGTDASVSLQIYGDKGKSDVITLQNEDDNFEQGEVDKFKV